MSTINIQYCALPECGKQFNNWRTKCCCRSHSGRYSSKAKHGTLHLPSKTLDEIKLAKKEKLQIKKNFVGPCQPNITRVYTKYDTKSVKPKPPKPPKIKKPKPPGKSIEQQKAEWVAYTVNRRKKRDCSMPLWANKEKILAFYVEARRLTTLTGIKHEVDHVIPSNHLLVCGLHNEFNLQVLTKTENCIKNNKFVID